MDKSYRAFAFASHNKRVLGIVLVTPTNSALNLILTLVFAYIFYSPDLQGFTELLLVKFFFGKLNLVASEIINSESNSTQLDGIKFLDSIVVLSLLIFE